MLYKVYAMPQNLHLLNPQNIHLLNPQNISCSPTVNIIINVFHSMNFLIILTFLLTTKAVYLLIIYACFVRILVPIAFIVHHFNGVVVFQLPGILSITIMHVSCLSQVQINQPANKVQLEFTTRLETNLKQYINTANSEV